MGLWAIMGPLMRGGRESFGLLILYNFCDANEANRVGIKFGRFPGIDSGGAEATSTDYNS